ncbi:MAG: hypothetical protein V7750_01315 [Sneathiella sp.]
MPPISLLPDCSRCASLCCVMLAFDKSNKFAIDKEAGEPCPNLAANGLCKIHDTLDDRGFGGCIQFNCHGAGQRVTQEVFGGKSWQQDISLLRPMSEAFRPMRQIHELLQLLEVSEKLPLSKEDKLKHFNLVQALTPPEGWTPASLTAFEKGPLREETMSFFSSLNNYVSREKMG